MNENKNEEKSNLTNITSSQQPEEQKINKAHNLVKTNETTLKDLEKETRKTTRSLFSFLFTAIKSLITVPVSIAIDVISAPFRVIKTAITGEDFQLFNTTLKTFDGIKGSWNKMSNQIEKTHETRKQWQEDLPQPGLKQQLNKYQTATENLEKLNAVEVDNLPEKIKDKLDKMIEKNQELRKKSYEKICELTDRIKNSQNNTKEATQKATENNILRISDVKEFVQGINTLQKTQNNQSQSVA